MRTIRVLKSGFESEESIQKTVMEWVRFNPKIRDFIFHIPNEGKRSARYGKILKDMGMRPGVSDLFIAMASCGYHGLWIELKSVDGKLTTHQARFMLDMAAQGYLTRVCFSSDDAIELIKEYCGI